MKRIFIWTLAGVLSLGAAWAADTTSPLLNDLGHALTNVASDVTTATTSDRFLIADVSEDPDEIKWADGNNALEIMGVTSTLGELNIMDGVTATAAEINQAADQSAQTIGAGATLTISAIHHNTVVLLDTAAGSVVTLPAATGTGLRVKFLVSVTPTSNLHSVAAAGTDEFAGVAYQVDTDTGDAFVAYPAIAADNFDILSLNGTTTGGLIGDWVEIVDIVAGTWSLVAHTNGNGTVATPLAAS